MHVVGEPCATPSPASPPGPGATLGGEQGDDLRRQRGRPGRRRVQHQLGVERRLVGVVDAGEARELAGPGLGVEALRVALLALLDRRVDEDLDERQAGRLVDRRGPGRGRRGRG